MSASASDGPVGAERSLGALVATATGELSALVHDEIALAKAQLRHDVKRGMVGGGAFTAAGVLLVFSLPMLSFALAYGIRAWSGWPMWACFLLSFAASVVVAALLALVGLVFLKQAKKSRGAQKSVASAKETAAVLQNVKPHPRAALPAQAPQGPGRDTGTTVARSSS
jgi:hypothetical protein